MVRRVIEWLARSIALLGGLVLIGLVVLNTISIVGRSISKGMNTDGAREWLGAIAQWVVDSGIDEINGTYELTEAGVAFAIFAFLPVCQLYGAHATVDVFTSSLGARSNRWLRAFWEIILTATIIFMTLRLNEGMMRYVRNGETTLFLQFPVWWSYAASLVAAVIACLTGLYCSVMRLLGAVRNSDQLPSALGE